MRGIDSRHDDDMAPRAGQEKGERFAQLLDAFAPERPKRGDILKGIILRMEDEQIAMDIGAKYDALVPPREVRRLSDAERERMKRGDEVPVRVIGSSKKGEKSLLVSLDGGLALRDWERAVELQEDAETIQLEVVGWNKGGLVVQFGRLRGFVPNSHLPILQRGMPRQSRSTIKREQVGEMIDVQVLEVNRKRNRLILSASEPNKQQIAQKLRELEIGEIIQGDVVDLASFGAFVDIGGIVGLAHISELAWRRIEHPREVVRKGEQLWVKVIGVDIERQRVSLSHKALQPSPWQTVEERYTAGDLVEGTVSNICDFGAFVLLPDGLEGLAHSSQLGFSGSIHPSTLLRKGDPVLARILSIDAQKERISLSLKDVTYDEEKAWQDRKDAQQAEEHATDADQ
jgi:small subunit ribosomal protein S1